MVTDKPITNKIDGELFEKLVTGGASNLKANIKTVNDLNVFPIPDGDTGDNMYMTMSGGISALKAVSENSVYRKAKALADGMLLNARGNSGVILSQLFYGLANGFKDEDIATVKDFGNALKSGVKQAYASVVKPVEGTMLTVAREAADFAIEHSTDEDTLDKFFKIFIDEMQKSLERTPELLEVLKEAGVIDSGGAGLLYITEGMKDALDGKQITDLGELSLNKQEVDFSKFTADSVMTFGYCTECLLQLQNSKVDAENFDEKIIIDYLSTIGDSIACFKTGTVIKVHVHTLTPYKVLEFCQKYGEFLTIKIENMTLQHSETEKSNKHDFSAMMTKKKVQHKEFALVTVATGEGLANVFTEFGADVVIDGGQGKNPSIENFIEAFDSLDADNIFVLPNNSNIIMAARQSAEMYKKSKVYVIETKDFGQAYSILSMLDYTGTAEEIAERMKEDMGGVTTGMITTSIRSANIDGVEINEGDYIGFTGKTMLVAETSVINAYKSLCEKILTSDNSFAIVAFGIDADDNLKEEVASFMAEKYPTVEFYAIDGGQEVYQVILIIE